MGSGEGGRRGWFGRVEEAVREGGSEGEDAGRFIAAREEL